MKKPYLALLFLLGLFFWSSSIQAGEPAVFAKKAYESMVAIDTSSKNYSERALSHFKTVFSFDGFYDEVSSDLKKKMTENELKELHDLFERVFFKNFAIHATEIAKKRMQHAQYLIKDQTTDKVVVIISGQTIKGPLKVSFHLKLGSDQEWKVFDIAIDDVLLSRNYRGSFNRIYREQGFEALIAKMTKKYHELENK